MRTRKNNLNRDGGSFRDPSGFVLYRNKKVFRVVNPVYKRHYDKLVSSGLYKSLEKENLIVTQKEIPTDSGLPKNIYKYLEVEKTPFISYPYEWCFDQLKDAALLTLKILKLSLDYDMILKDASAYNIQFIGYRPILIDTLSFEKYNEGEPWVAYRQYCQHFLAPLVLMKYSDVRLNQLSRAYIDGIPLDLATKLLPFKSKVNFGIFSHIYLHSRSQKHYSDKEIKVKNRKLSKNRLLALIESLESTTKKIELKNYSTEWANYYSFTNYSKKASKNKHSIVKKFLSKTKTNILWDLGANNGEYSRIASANNIYTISSDIDPIAINNNYLSAKKNKDNKLLPLLLDLTNPSSGMGWANTERKSIVERGPADTILALALVHHLAISNNLPFNNIASFFGDICTYLVIEFVPKSDSQVQKLLSTREDIFSNYTEKDFITTFDKYFEILTKEKVTSTHRTIYLMKSLK